MATTDVDLQPIENLGDGTLHKVHQATLTPLANKTAWQRFISFIWDADYYEKQPQERRLIFKLDIFLLTALTIGWWLKNIDQSNLANAYVSGMQEDLHITGNQYTYMGTIYSAVVCAMCLPANFLVMKIRPSIFLAMAEIGWGVFTFAQAGAQSYQAMYGFRFCVAFFEGWYYANAYFILGSWYTKTELAKRIGLWFIAGPAGSAFSGYMQAGIYSSLNGHAGLAGWRWLYIICGLMTVPCGFLMYFCIPDFPENTTCWYLSETDRELARSRVTRNGQAAVKNKINWSFIGRAIKDWRFWTLVPWYAIYGCSVQNAAYFTIYLKAYGYSVTARNVLPSTMWLIEIPFLFFYSYISDRLPRGRRGLLLLAPAIWGLFPTGVLAFWAPSNALRVFAFMVNGSLYATPVFYAWVAELCGHDTELRAFITGATSCCFYMVNAWLPAIIFLQTDGPRFKKGFISNFVFTLVSAIGVCIIWYFASRDKHVRAIIDRPQHEEAQHEDTPSAVEGVEGEEEK